MNWFIILLGFLGADTEPSYALIMDDMPTHSQSACAEQARPMSNTLIANQRKTYPDLEGHWVCANDKANLSTTEMNYGWYPVWMGYKGSNTWASVSFLGPAHYLDKYKCYRDADRDTGKLSPQYAWEFLCVQPISGAR